MSSIILDIVINNLLRHEIAKRYLLHGGSNQCAINLAMLSFHIKQIQKSETVLFSTVFS